MQEKEKNKKNSKRSILLSGLVILFFLGVISIYYLMVYSETKEKIIKSAEVSSISAASEINQYITKGSDTLRLISYTIDTMIRGGKSQEEIQAFLEDQTTAIGNSTYTNTTGIYGWIRGEYLDGSKWVPEADYVPTERPWYIDARANIGNYAVVDPYVDAMTGSITITFSKTLCDGKSVAAMDFYMDKLQTITEEVVDIEDVDMEIVVDKKYRVITHSDKVDIGVDYLEDTGSFGNALVEKLRATDEGYISLAYEGEDYIVYATSVANDWLCLSIFNTTNIFGQLLVTLIFTIVACILVVIILLSIMVRSNRKQESFDRLSNVVEALAAAIDAKDTYTKGHSGRVADYAREISRRFGYSKKRQDEVHMMGLLHDVGKIGIPDSVINKPGKLTDEEFGIIKTHPEIGAKILAKATGMPTALVGARWHHEKYGGNGYPDGLSGKEIPEEARIIAVADAYDAMTSERSYRKGLDQAIVRKEIEKGRGTQFDPNFADIMLKMIDEDIEYKMKGD